MYTYMYVVRMEVCMYKQNIINQLYATQEEINVILLTAGTACIKQHAHDADFMQWHQKTWNSKPGVTRFNILIMPSRMLDKVQNWKEI